jgi:hypothetical protein
MFADMCCWVLQILFFNVADVAFRCCRHVVFGCCVEEKGEEAPDVGCCTQHESQHDRNTVATWSQHGGRKERLPMLDVASNRVRNIFVTDSQHARNIYSVDFI